MPRAAVNDIELEYETFGAPADPTVLLITGWGAQLLFWDEAFCAQLADRGFHVIRFDNRDVGLSTKLTEFGVPDVGAVRAGSEAPPYTLDDMAADGVGLLDALGIDAAHVVGISMGGEIGQVMGLNHPDRVISLVSMMSSIGGQDTIHPPSQRVDRSAPPPADETGLIERRLAEIRAMSSPRYFDEERTREAIRRAMSRARSPDGTERQAAAIHAGPSRAETIGQLSIPLLVIHGKLDLPLENAHRVAAAVPGSRLEIIPDLKHDLPPQLWGTIIDLVTEHARAAEVGAGLGPR